eukprot:5769899-Ditylum_brightwellii.AAC.1
MNAVDKGDQRHLFGAGFSSKLICFGAFTRQSPKKWKFSLITAEESMHFAAPLDEDRQRDRQKIVPFIMDIKINEHAPTVDDIDNLHKKGVKQECLSYDACSMEETAMRSLGAKTTCMFSLKQQGMAYCNRHRHTSHIKEEDNYIVG